LEVFEELSKLDSKFVVLTADGKAGQVGKAFAVRRQTFHKGKICFISIADRWYAFSSDGFKY